jgi:hypothetical protein
MRGTWQVYQRSITVRKWPSKLVLWASEQVRRHFGQGSRDLTVDVSGTAVLGGEGVENAVAGETLILAGNATEAKIRRLT